MKASVCSFPSWSQHKVKTWHWLIPLSEPPLPDDACYSDAQNCFSQSSWTWKLRQKSEASTDTGMQTHRNAWGRAGHCKYPQSEKDRSGGARAAKPMLAAQRWQGHRGTRHPPPASRWKHLHFSSWLFFPRSFILLKVLQSGHSQGRPQMGTREVALLLPEGNQEEHLCSFYCRLVMKGGGRCFLLIKGQREWDHCCTPSMHPALGSYWMTQCSLIRERVNKCICHSSVTISKWTQLSKLIFSVQEKCQGTLNENKNKRSLLLLKPRSQDCLLSNENNFQNINLKKITKCFSLWLLNLKSHTHTSPHNQVWLMQSNFPKDELLSHFCNLNQLWIHQKIQWAYT